MSQHGTPDRAPAPDSPADPSAWPCPLLPFLAAASVWLAAVHVVSRAQAMEVLSVGASMLLVGAPICLAGVYTSTLRRQFRLVLFQSKGWLYGLLSRRLLASLFWTVWALAISFVLLLRFHVYGGVEWAVLAATIPMFALVFAALHRVFAKELRPDAAATEALVWSRRACPALVLLLYVGALALWSDLPRYASLDDAIEAHRSAAAAWSGSALVREALHWGAYFDGLEAYALGRLGSADSLWPLLAMGAGNLAIFYNVCLALSCFRIPRAGFVQARLAPRSFENVFAAAAVATFLVDFVYFPLLARLDEYVARSPDPARVRTQVERETTAVARQAFERIDDGHYRPGTLAQIASARAAALGAVSAAAERFRREVDAAFERLEDEAVGEYLDWYYSLPAEYGRVGMMLQGRLEDYLTEQARRTFEQEKWFRSVEAVFETMLSVEEQARAAYERTVRDILDRNRVRPERPAFDVTLTASLEDIVQPSLHQDVIPAAHRLGAAGVAAGAGSAAAGGITFVIVQKVTARCWASRFSSWPPRRRSRRPPASWRAPWRAARRSDRCCRAREPRWARSSAACSSARRSASPWTARSWSSRRRSAGTTSSASSSPPFGRRATSSPTSSSAGRRKARRVEFPTGAGSSRRRGALYSRYRGRADATQA